jgi:hypothetical protein
MSLPSIDRAVVTRDLLVLNTRPPVLTLTNVMRRLTLFHSKPVSVVPASSLHVTVYPAVRADTSAAPGHVAWSCKEELHTRDRHMTLASGYQHKRALIARANLQNMNVAFAWLLEWFGLELYGIIETY